MYGKSDTDFPGTRLLNVIACINAGFDISGMILILALMFIGGELTIRSVSRNLSKDCLLYTSELPTKRIV